MKKRDKLRKFIFKLVTCAMLAALQIVLSRFAGIQAQYFQFSLGFVPIAVCSAMLGPIFGAACAFVADFLGVIIGGTGAYNPLFSINAVLFALVYALFLYKKELSVKRAIICEAVQTACISIPLTPLWLWIYFNFFLDKPRGYSVIFTSKLAESLIVFPLKAAVLSVVSLYLIPKLRKHYFEGEKK